MTCNHVTGGCNIVPPGVPVVAVEAAIGQGWDRWTGATGGFVGMTGFGASAPYKELYERFGITSETVCNRAKSLISG